MDVEQDDEALAQRAGHGDREAFQLLLERHYGLIYRLAFRFTANQADAEDLAQDICASLARKIKSFQGNSRFTTWLYRVSVNACKDALRSMARAHQLEENYAEARAMALADDADDKLQTVWLFEALEGLTDDLRETAILVLAEDLSHAEAGDVLQVKEGTVSWRMSEVRKQLKQQVQAGNGVTA
jgi:RNA polymerase sigma-70 factor (ECF subfamily)